MWSDLPDSFVKLPERENEPKLFEDAMNVPKLEIRANHGR